MPLRQLNKRWVAAAVCAAAAATGVYVAAQPVASGEQVIRITAKKFEYTPPEITLKKGVPVILELATEDILMGFDLPELKVRADIVPGKVTRVRVVPDKVGSFEFLCDVFCGSGHEEMGGKITVVD